MSYITVGPIGSRDAITTAFVCEDNQIKVACGCFYGTLDEFAAKVKETHGDSQHALEYNAFIEFCKVRFADVLNRPDKTEGEDNDT